MAAFHVFAGANGALEYPEIRRISISDLSGALRSGVEDFMEKPTHLIFIGIIYPLVGVVLATWTSGANALPLLFPLASGFALIGPIAAVGLYEISRRREQGLEVSWRDALEVRHSPALPSIMAVGSLLVAIFITWLLVAQGLYTALMGPQPPASIPVFLEQIFSTSEGMMLIVLGNAIGLLFAIVALCTSVIAFPLLLDRDVGAWAAVQTSWRAAMANPVEIAAWGLIVAALLVIGSIPIFAGLAVVVPILGHATWHLYRRVVEPPKQRTRRRTKSEHGRRAVQ
jgi:uncharacterized membrane protein